MTETVQPAPALRWTALVPRSPSHEVSVCHTVRLRGSAGVVQRRPGPGPATANQPRPTQYSQGRGGPASDRRSPATVFRDKRGRTLASLPVRTDGGELALAGRKTVGR